MTTTLGRRVGLLEGAVQRQLRRQFGEGVVRLRETMAPEHARLVVRWMHAHGLGEQPEYMYCVRFAGEELWGESAEPSQMLYADLFERYLEPDTSNPPEG